MAVGAEVVEYRFHFCRVLVACQRLYGALIFIQKDDGGVSQAVVEPLGGEFVVAARSALLELVSFVFENDVFLLFGVEFHGVVMVVQILRYGGADEGGGVHAFAPAAPVGVHVHEDFALFGFAFLEGFFERHPFDFHGIDGFRFGRFFGGSGSGAFCGGGVCVLTVQ